jgi:hypothetical protein
MNLWTYHDPNFSLTSSRVDHALSPYADDPAIMEAYRELGYRLNIPDVQIVWCYTRHGDYPLTGIEHREWHLAVPPDEIIACTDGLVWNRIIGKPPGATTEMYDKWRQEARQLYPHDATSRHRHEQEQLQQFRNESPPPGGWWSRLVVPLHDGEMISAIIRHPVRESWIVATRLVSSSLNNARRLERIRQRRMR